MPYLINLLETASPDVFCINEYGVNPEFPKHPKFNGYERVSVDLQIPAAGVAIFVKSGYADQVRLVSVKHQMRWAQVAAIDINDMRIATIYRSPNMPDEEYDELIRVIDKFLTNKTIIVSDMNVHADWLEFLAEKNQPYVKSKQKLLNFFKDKGLLQFNFMPTRKKAILDVALTNDHNSMMSCHVLRDWHAPQVDHCPVQVEMRLKVWHQDIRIVRPKRKIDLKQFKKRIFNVDVENMGSCGDINRIDAYLTKATIEAMEAATPEIEIDLNKPPPDPEFKMSKKTETLYDRQKNLYKRRDFKGAKRVSKKVRESLQNDKRKWMTAKARDLDADPQEVWKMINQATDKGSMRGGLRIDEDTETLEFDPEKKPDILATRYGSVMTPKTVPTCDPDDMEGSEVQIGLTNIDITEGDILDAANRANNSWASDHVGLNMKVTKLAVKHFLPLLILMFNLSMTMSVMADTWLTALIVPVPKKGDPTLAKSWRPVTIEHTWLRLIESIVNVTIVTYLESISFFHRMQFGFRKGRSCVHNLTDYWGFVADLMVRRGAVDVVYADTSAAFDRLSHGILLDKLYYECGIAGNLWKWMRAWLSNRVQFVKVGKNRSRNIDVTSSCLQGSCLGTTCWTIYINQLLFLIEETIYDLEIEDCCFWYYADDFKLAYFPSEANTKKVNKLLKIICKEMRQLHLTFNPTKCSVLTIGKKNKKYEVKKQDVLGNDVPLVRVTTERDLGLWVDSDGTFTTMKERSLSTAETTAKFLSRIFKVHVWNTLVQTYHSHVFSRLSYASELWRQTTETFAKSVDIIYEMYFRYAKAPSNAWPPYTPSQLLLRKDLILLHAINNDIGPVEKWKIFPEKISTSVVDNRVTRSQSREEAVKLMNKRWSKNLILQRNVETWNSIPLAIRTADKRSFKIYVDEKILPTLSSEVLRTELINGEMRKKWKRKEEYVLRAKEVAALNENIGNERSVMPDPLYNERLFEDNFLRSSWCSKKNSTKAKTTIALLEEYAPYQLLCHCTALECKTDVYLFETKYGPSRNYLKAWVRDFKVFDSNGQIKKKFAQRFSVKSGSLGSSSFTYYPSSREDDALVADPPLVEEQASRQATAITAAAPQDWDASLFYK